jgi:small nuclear ribonucleoprotein E
LLFRLFHTKTRVQVWLFEQGDLRFEGLIIGFDEYMNLVMEECEELSVKKGTRTYLGRIMLKGDNVSLIRPVESNFSY